MCHIFPKDSPVHVALLQEKNQCNWRTAVVILLVDKVTLGNVLLLTVWVTWHHNL